MVKIAKNHDLGLFLLRLGVGIVFIAHGWDKFAHMSQTIGFFAKLGFPTTLTYVVAAVELVGGILLILGFWTDLIAVLLAIIAIVALVYVKITTFKTGLIGGYEVELLLFAASLAIMFLGPGRFVAQRKR